jgi:hypothetical protein
VSTTGASWGDPVRVGDRYVREDDVKITITKITGEQVEYSAIYPESPRSTWTHITMLPLPATWTKAGSGPEPKVICARCLVIEAEPGQVYCWTCLALEASVWATLTEEEAQMRTLNMIAGRDGALAGIADREADERAERGETDGD